MTMNMGLGTWDEDGLDFDLNINFDSIWKPHSNFAFPEPYILEHF